MKKKKKSDWEEKYFQFQYFKKGLGDKNVQKFLFCILAFQNIPRIFYFKFFPKNFLSGQG